MPMTTCTVHNVYHIEVSMHELCSLAHVHDIHACLVHAMSLCHCMDGSDVDTLSLIDLAFVPCMQRDRFSKPIKHNIYIQIP